MKGKQKDKLVPSDEKNTSKSKNDSFAEYVEDLSSSDDDFQSVVTNRKRKSRENTPKKEPPKRLKGKEKATDSQIALDDYDLEDSIDDFFQPIFKRPVLSDSRKYGVESSKSAAAGSSSSSKKKSTTTSSLSHTALPKSKPASTTPKSDKASSKPSSSRIPADKTSGAIQDPEETGNRVMTVKTTVKTIWKPEYVQPLYDLVNTTNILVTHTFAFIKYILIKEMAANEDFILKDFVQKDFFVEVFLSLVLGKGSTPGRLKDVTRNYRQLISKYKDSYCEYAGYTPLKLVYAQQIALYECTKIHTAYYNNIKAHFGNRLRKMLNTLFKRNEKMESIRKKMKANNSTEESINEAIRKQVHEPCNQVKLSVIRKEIPSIDLLDAQAIEQLKAFFSCYPENYAFQKSSIYYDVKANPGYHFKAFFKIAEMFETEKMKLFTCFPLRTTYIPCYMTLDSKIIHHHILKNKSQFKAVSKFETWGAVVDLTKKAFKDQGPNKSIRFRGTLETDGVGVSVIKQNMDNNRKLPRIRNAQAVTDDKTEYIEELGQDGLKKAEGKCVLIDPGRRDLMYCLKETSTAKDRQTLTYTKMNRNKMQRHLKILREKTRPEVIKAGEIALSNTESSSLDIEKYVNYIKTRESVDTLLRNYYGNETQVTDTVYFPGSCFEFNVNDKGDLYFGHLYVTRIRGYFPQQEAYSHTSTSSHMYATYLEIMMKQDHVLKRLKETERAEVVKIAAGMLETGQIDLLKQRASQLLEKLQILPFRKLKFSSKLYFDQNDAQLVKRLKNKFGSDSTLVLGNWSAPNMKYQEPTRNKGLIAMLKKSGFRVYLIDEFKTSSLCPECEGSLETFKTVVNPRPYQRRKMPTVKCHGLLRCKNITCLEKNKEPSAPIRRKLWNRDLAAVLNFRKILMHLRDTGKRHPLFSRKYPTKKQ